MKVQFVTMLLVVILFLRNASGQVNVNPELLNQLIEKTFNGYSCLNVFIHEESQIERMAMVKEIHQTHYSFLLLNSLNMANENCGFVLVSNDIEDLHFLGNLTFNVNIRILHISECNMEALMLFEDNPMLFEDNDVLLVELADSISILVKSRYGTDFKPGSLHFKMPFFYSKNYVPVKLNRDQRTVNVVTFNCPLFGSINGGELADGVETRIFKEVTQQLNLTPQVVVPTGGERWGTVYPNGTISGGIIKYLFTRKADIGFCSVWIESSKFPYLTFSYPWNMVCVKFFVPKPKKIPTHWNSIFKPLPATLWMLVLLAALVTTSVCIALRHLQNWLFSRTEKVLKPGWDIPCKHCLSSCGLVPTGSKTGYTFMTIIGSLLLAKSPTNIHQENDAHQDHMLLWWSMFALLIANLYSSSLISHLTYPQFQPMTDTVESMVEAGYYWGTPYDPNSDQVFDFNNPWHIEFANRHIYETQEGDRLKRLLAGNYTLFVKCVGDKSYMEVDNLPSDVLHDLRTVHGCMRYFMLGFGYRKTLPYAAVADRVISHLVESGITLYWMNRLFEQKYSSTTFEKLYEYKTPPEDIELTSLSIQSLLGAFYLLAAGAGLAAVAFVDEMVKGRKLKRLRHC